ncbi:MAG: gluconokinase [Roseibium sp.]|uniref:gluconokinase n=1 Tax=Roseibium sp. TaxID=1936156 RepID=UPI00261F9966|nr:gluconokinase [Roseibium sp.]MCV0427629.1 gluconokinase [Roseibium sp.]
MSAFVVMGVSGCGKSKIGQGFARAIGGSFFDGDDLHPEENIAKMSRGEPLNDSDREPWLDRVGMRLKDASEPTVIACSALKRAYRERIADRAGGPVTFLYLEGTRDVLSSRMKLREGHFMPLALLDSQLETLEPPEPDELSVKASIDQTPDQVVAELLAGIRRKM